MTKYFKLPAAMKISRFLTRAAAPFAVFLSLVSCGGGGGGGGGGFPFPPSGSAYTVGGTVAGLNSGVTVTLLNSGGNALSVGSNGAFTFSTAVAAGGSYAVTVGAQPSEQNCTVSNGTGSNISANITSVRVTCAGAPEFAYVAHPSADSVSAYKIDSLTGALTSLGTVASGASPFALAVHPSKKFVYAANSGDSTISTYAINQTNGKLAQVGTDLSIGHLPQSIAVDPAGKFVYTANPLDNNITVLAVDQSSGALSEISGSPFPAAGGPTGISIHPGGKFLYTSNQVGNTVSKYMIDQGSGAVLAAGATSVPGGFGPTFVSVDPAGKAVYITNIDRFVIGFSIDPVSGDLTQTAALLTVAGDAGAARVLPSGKFVYLPNNLAQTVSGFAIDQSSGVLSPLSGSPFAAGGTPIDIAINASGKFLVTANWGDETVSAYSIDQKTGALAPVGAAVQSGPRPRAIVVVQLPLPAP